jgi:hypothetical protein
MTRSPARPRPAPAAPDLRQRARRWLEKLLRHGERAAGEVSPRDRSAAAQSGGTRRDRD